MEVAHNSAFAAQLIKPQTLQDVPEQVECPFELEYIWNFFKQLDARRPCSGMGFSPITHEAITAWSDGLEVGITPFERSCIVALDDAYRLHCSKKEPKDE